MWFSHSEQACVRGKGPEQFLPSPTGAVCSQWQVGEVLSWAESALPTLPSGTCGSHRATASSEVSGPHLPSLDLLRMARDLRPERESVAWQRWD